MRVSSQPSWPSGCCFFAHGATFAAGEAVPTHAPFSDLKAIGAGLVMIDAFGMGALAGHRRAWPGSPKSR